MDVKPVAGTQASINMNSQNVELYAGRTFNLQDDLKTNEPEFKKEREKISPELIERAIEDLKKKLSILNTQLQIKIDKDTDIVVVKVIDKETNKVIRQIPPEYILKIAKYLDEIAGLLYNEKV